MDRYFQIEATIDRKIIGRSELSLTVEVNDKRFLAFRSEKLVDINKYFEMENIYKNFPKDIKGKMYQKKKTPIDIMQVMPSCLTLKYVVSEKVQEILQTIVNDESQYHFEEITIDGSSQKFFFLFIPFLKSSEYIDYSKTVFYNSSNKEKVIFGDFETYEVQKKINNYLFKELYVSKEVRDRKIFSFPVAGTFYCNSIIEAFERENVIGYDIVNGGDFKVNLIFE
ncbi:hypothetical protein MKJ01_15960 [Chryseobacterium sp. SSA4.19]|uniref:hypothetical protein n=1 Tax=Chryseobacterium sp. SSA4.19 TaxID=2919915 RepID=UPI001F4DE226|nr:hypothetical protein [Chryseobacterium sp. SSA4.19]MCJ8155260.1 hypothetical protein [Chryseobacterium sp. SSA4.19]